LPDKSAANGTEKHTYILISIKWYSVIIELISIRLPFCQLKLGKYPINDVQCF